MTVTEVKGSVIRKGITEIYRGAEYAVTFLPKLKVDVAVPANLVDRVVDHREVGTHGNRSVTARFFISGIDSTMRIRTGEIDEAALL